MPVNLVQCDGNTITYEEQSCEVKFTAGDQSKEITIKQLANVIATGDNHPYYEWGRKDPFYPSNRMDNTTKTWYDKKGMPSTDNPVVENFSSGDDCIKNYILKPNVMQEQEQGDNFYYNLWSSNNTEISTNNNPVIKTIYDPCPVGFKLPASNAFTGFTTSGLYVLSPKEINGTWDNSKKGWNFYTDFSQNQTIFFPASGWRSHSNGEMNNVGDDVYYWSSVPYAHDAGRSLWFNSLHVNPWGSSNRSCGNGVRPNQDDL